MIKNNLTRKEKQKFNYMVDLFGGSSLVDKSKIRARIINLRKRKSNRTTSQDMRDLMGY